jgi:hypothetical protein
MDWKKYIRKTPFKNDADKIVNAFRVYKIHSYEDLQNLSIKSGGICAGFDSFLLVAEVNKAFAEEKASDLPPIEEAADASAAKEPKAEVKTGQPKKAPTPKRSGGRARSGASDTKAAKAAPAKKAESAKPADK